MILEEGEELRGADGEVERWKGGEVSGLVEGVQGHGGWLVPRVRLFCYLFVNRVFCVVLDALF